MDFFIATSDKQLGICLRMLCAEGLTDATVSVILTDKRKIEYHVTASMDKQEFERLNRRYEILTAY